MPRSPVITDLLPEQSVQRRLAEAEEAQRNRARVTTGAPGAPGATGAEGKEGHGAGLLYKWSTNTENSDPGTGKLKQGGPLGENVIFRISETDLDGNAVGDYLKTWDDNGGIPHGYMFMRKRGAPGTFIVFKFGRVTTTITDNGTWLFMSEFEKVAGSATGFANNDEVYIEYFAAGQKGPTGSTGATGAAGEPGGFKYWWYSEQTKSTGKGFAFNTKFANTATKIYVGSETLPGQNIKAFLESFDDAGTSTDRGFIIIRDLDDPTYYAIFKVTGTATSEASGVMLTVEYITGSGELSNPILLHEHSLEFYRSGATGAKGETGAAGAKGETGAAGNDSGLVWEYNNTTTIANPGTEKFRMNSTTRSAVTQIALRENSMSGGGNPAAYVETWDDSTSTIKGFLILRKKGEPSSFAIYQLNSMNDEGEWDKINVTFLAEGGGSWASGDKITWDFSRTGDKGEVGAEGAAAWTPVLSSNMKQLTTSSFECTTSTGEWSEQVYSVEGFSRGCFLTFKGGQTNKQLMMGLNTDPTTNASYASLDYALYLTDGGQAEVWEGGAFVVNLGAYTTSTVFSIIYDGANVRYYMNGELKRTVARAIGSPLYFDSSFNPKFGLNEKVLNVHFGPVGEAGAKGETGATGAMGAPTGVKLTFLTNTEATDPGSGKVKLNNTFALANRIYISEKDAAAGSLVEWLTHATGGESAIKSYATIVQEDDYSKWATFFLTKGTDKGEWRELEGALVAGPGGIENNKPVRITFARSGDKGSAGEKGAAGENASLPLRDVWEVGSWIPGGQAAGKYLLGTNGIVAGGANSGTFGISRYIDPKHYEASGKNTRFRVIWSFSTGLFAPSGETKFKGILYKVTATTGSNVGLTRTTEAIGETGAIKLEGNKTAVTAEIKEVTLAAAGEYILAVEIPAVAGTTSVFVSAQMYVENI